MNPVVAVSVLIVAISIALVAWHIAEWRAHRRTEIAEGERQFAWRRYRRRLQASSLIGVVGGMIFASRWVVAGDRFTTHPIVAACYLGAVMVLLSWVLLLAAGDAISSRNFFRAEHRRQVAEQIRFQAEVLRKAQRAKTSASDGGDGSE